MIPIKYEPLMEVVTFNGEKYYFETEKSKQIAEMMEKNKFIAFPRHGSLVAVSTISVVRPALQQENTIENTIAKEPREIQEKVRRYIAIRNEETKGAPVTVGVLENMIKKAKGEDYLAD